MIYERSRWWWVCNKFSSSSPSSFLEDEGPVEGAADLHGHVDGAQHEEELGRHGDKRDAPGEDVRK